MTLQDLCLNKIVNMFRRFNLAFTTGEDANLKKGLEFLQRKYSFEILQRLNYKHRIRDEYVDFLFNRHLKVLDTEWLSTCSWEIVTRKFAEIGPNLQELCIKKDETRMGKVFYQNINLFTMEDNDKWTEFLCYLPNIKVIKFETFCDDAFLQGVVQYCHNIETINIRNSHKVTDRGLKFFCLKKKGKLQCPLLKELYLNGTAVKDAGMKDLLQHFPSIDRTDYTKLGGVLYGIHKRDINALDKVKPYNLTHLNLMHVALTQHHNDILKISLSVCPHLKVLLCLVFDQEQLKFCYNLTELEELRLDCFVDASIEINEFLTFRGNKLISLGIRNSSLLHSVLALNCPRLNKLQMIGVTFLNDKGSIPMLHNLEELSIENCIFSDNQTSISLVLLLSSSPNLKKLCFENCKLFTSEMKAEILKCCTQCPLEQIRFSNSSVEPQLFKDILLTCSTLNCMDLHGCKDDENFKYDLFRIARNLPKKPYLSIGSDFSDNDSFDRDDDSDDYASDVMDYSDDYVSDDSDDYISDDYDPEIFYVADNYVLDDSASDVMEYYN